MTTIHHLNCGTLRSPFIGKAICHCLLLEDKNGLALVDTGFGVAETRTPVQYFTHELIDFFAIEFDENHTALRQIERMGLNTKNVKHCIITHLDFDHAGGLADFPDATVHVSLEEYDSFKNGNPRYLASQFAHRPKFKSYDQSDTSWFGLPARKIEIGFETDIFLIPLFGHTTGQCGVAIEKAEGWLLYAADAFYSTAELKTDNHPVTRAAAAQPKMIRCAWGLSKVCWSFLRPIRRSKYFVIMTLLILIMLK
jgi:glyoxylase-like metal-dependent hydrolase (beta-lactamase superfamily II)